MKKVKEIASYILIIILILTGIVFCVRKQFQNDTFYSIRIGDILVHNGINALDVDTISWHKNLNYCNPHWLNDIIIYFSYYLGNLDGIFILTLIESFILRITNVFYSKFFK